MNKSISKIILSLMIIFFLTISFSCSNPSSDNSTADSTSQPTPNNPPAPTPDPEVYYTISFNKNNESATGSTASIKAKADSIVTLTANGFDLEGYTFTGWNTKADGTGTSFYEEMNLQINDNIILYAQWISLEGTKHAISLETVENGSVTINKIEAVEGDTIRILLNNAEQYILKSLLIVSSDGKNLVPVIDTYDWKKCYFTMPNHEVTIKVSFCTEHLITINQPHCMAGIIQGNIKSDTIKAIEGSKVTISVETHKNFIIQKINIKDAGGNIIETIENNNNNVFSFTMPDQNIFVEGVFKNIVMPIFVQQTLKNGKVILSQSNAVPGTEIEVSFIPDDFYILDSFEIKGNDDGLAIESAVSLTDSNTYKFIMPDKRVKITVTFVYGAHTITIADSEYVNISVSKTAAIKGSEIEISIEQNESCKIKDIVIVDNEGTVVASPVKKDGFDIYKFIMPDMDVIIDPLLPEHTVSFSTDSTKKIDSQILEHGKKVTFVSATEDYIHRGFLGWFLEPECKNSYDFDSNVTEDITLYAKWERLDINMLMDDVEAYIKNLKYSSKIRINDTKNLFEDNVIKKGMDYLYSTNPEIEIDLTLSFTTEGHYINLNSFRNSKNLVVLSVNGGVPKFGGSAFSGCTKLKKAFLNNSGYFQEGYTFYGFSALEYVTLPPKNTKISRGAFEGCSNLPKILIPETVNQILPDAFYRCDKLQEVTFIDKQSKWQIKKTLEEEPITVVQVNDPTQNANLLRDTYARYYWIKEEE